MSHGILYSRNMSQRCVWESRWQVYWQGLFLLAALAWVGASALSAKAASLDWAPIGDPGNAADSTGFGAVDYNFRISKFEVTNGQYVEFLNSVAAVDTFQLYDEKMADYGIQQESNLAGGFSYSITSSQEHNWANKPVNAVSWYDAIRFANWMHNGQGSGDTETGAYTLLGGSPTPLNPGEIVRNPGARVWLPSVDEWYKAAYFDPALGEDGGYWKFPTTSDQAPSNSLDDLAGNNANFTGSNLASTLTGPVKLTDVGAFSDTTSPAGVFDLGGNVSEWSESLTPGAGMLRAKLGGSWGSLSGGLQSRNVKFSFNGPAVNSIRGGFRLASIPEPATAALLATGVCFGLLATSRRRLKK